MSTILTFLAPHSSNQSSKMKSQVSTTLPLRGELEKLDYSQLQQLCKEKGIDSGGEKNALIEALLGPKEEPGTGSRHATGNEQSSVPFPSGHKNKDLASIALAISNVSEVVEPGETPFSQRLSSVERRVSKLEDQQRSPDPLTQHSQSSGGQAILADLAKRLEKLETLVFSMPIDLSKTVGKLKITPPPSGFELDRRIAALEVAIHGATDQCNSSSGPKELTVKPISWEAFRANYEPSFPRSFSPFEHVGHPSTIDPLRPTTSSSKFLMLPAPASSSNPSHFPPRTVSPGGINPFEQPPSPAPFPLDVLHSRSSNRSLRPDEVVGPEFTWVPDRADKSATSPAASEGSTGAGFVDISED
ncbi:hypothetical protein FRB90_006173 [Tulasnella sp. 427]|nr:hypothetical protein FRB90_006173 [Tulasnella sp. 427]